MIQHGAQDVYFEDSIEVLVGEGQTLDVDAVRKTLEKQEIEFTSIDLAGAG